MGNLHTLDAISHEPEYVLLFSTPPAEISPIGPPC